MWICQKISTSRQIKNNIVVISCLAMIVFLFLNSHIHVKAVETINGDVDKHIIVVLVPDLSFNEMKMIQDSSKFPQLWESGAYGAVNLRPEGSYSYLNNMVSIATGKRSLGVSGWNAYERNETLDGTPVDNLIIQWYGQTPTSTVVHPHVNLLVEKNLNSSFQGEVGWLGASLEDKGVFTYILGNSDSRDERARYGSLLVMNRNGEASGNLQGGITEDIYSPSGVKTEIESLLNEIEIIHNENKHTFTVVEWGDLYRLFKEEPNMIKEHFRTSYNDVLTRLEEAIYRLTTETKGEVWLLSPSVNSQAYKEKNQLGPLWLWKEDESERGLLFSETTRRYSLLSNTDLAITWDESFFEGIDYRDKTVGHPLHYVEADSAEREWSLAAFCQRINEINYVYDKRGAVLSSYVSSLVVMLVAVSFMIWLLKESERWKRVASILLLSGILSPLLFLLTSPWVLALSAFMYVLILFLVSLIIAALLRQFSSNGYSLAAFLFFLALTVDVISGSYLIHRSFLSYDPVIGARYYGIGNEFAGIYLASGLLMIAPLLKANEQPFTRWTKIVGVVSVMTFVLGSASLGANAGASLSAGIILIYASLQLLLKGAKLPLKLMIVVGIPLIMLVFLYVLQMAQPSSHISIAFQKLLAGDWYTIWQTIVRKVQMNWKIFKISYWTQLFVTSYFFIGIVLWRRQKEQLDPRQFFLINCCIVVSLALLVLNDSGIVAAATSMFITLSVCYGWSIEGKRMGE